MRNRLSRLALAAGAVGLSLILISTGPAGAASHPSQSLAAAGSDTTYFMMKLIAGHYQSSSANSNHDKITMIPPVNTSPFPASVTVPADKIHPAKTWDSSSPAATPPNGSGAGITALVNDSTGNIAFARSSRGPNPGETNVMNFWAYALGAVDYVTFPGTHAPAAGLTQAQLISIYTCDPITGEPFASNWSQVGGMPGVIIKYAPQTSSGTYSFFNSKMLGGRKIDQNCHSDQLSIFHEEHDSRAVTPQNYSGAIDVFDWARWRAQKGGFEPNLTNGSVLGSFGANASSIESPSAANVNEKASRFFGTRYVYNVVRKVAHPKSDADQINDVTRLVGVRNVAQGGAQYICSGKAKADIAKAGFVPLAKFATGGIGLGSSFCRLNPKAL